MYKICKIMNLKILFVLFWGLTSCSKETYFRKLETQDEHFKIETSFSNFPVFNEHTTISLKVQSFQGIDSADIVVDYPPRTYSKITNPQPWLGRIKKNDVYEGSFDLLLQELGLIKLYIRTTGYIADKQFQTVQQIFFEVDKTGKTRWLKANELLPDSKIRTLARYVPISLTDSQIVLKDIRRCPVSGGFPSKEFDLRVKVYISPLLSLMKHSKVTLEFSSETELDSLWLRLIFPERQITLDSIDMEKGFKSGARQFSSWVRTVKKDTLWTFTFLVKPTDIAETDLHIIPKAFYKQCWIGPEQFSAQYPLQFAFFFDFDINGALEMVSYYSEPTREYAKDGGTWYR